MGLCSVKDTNSMNHCLNETFREQNGIIFNRLETVGQITHLSFCDGIDDTEMYI